MNIAFNIWDISTLSVISLFSTQLWQALQSDFPSHDWQTNWIRALLFLGLLLLYAGPLILARQLPLRAKQWVKERKWKRRPSNYIV